MPLCLQDPNDPKSTYLLEALLEACDGALSGGGAFGFASKDGVNLFFSDDAFQTFAAKGNFDLLVGVDAITNLQALAAIEAVRKPFPQFGARAFLTDKMRAIFHPKMCWFRRAKSGTLITGSGNLTGGGLRWNVEAFTVSSLSIAEIKEVEDKWQTFVASNNARILPLDDPRVQRCAEANVARAREKLRAIGEVPEVLNELDVDLPETSDVVPVAKDEVLLAEIPKSGNRWNQANFDVGSFRNFFGAKEGKQQRIFLYHVSENGLIGNREVRPSVSVRSQNHRFELEAASGLVYPTSGRPIGVFVRVATRTFLYRLLMPTDPAHAIVSTLLKQISPVTSGKMRREVIDVATLKRIWPNSPLWQNQKP